MEWKFHPIAAIFPLMDGDELSRLADDIKANGLRDDVVTYEGMVLDGRNRVSACGIAGVAPRCRPFVGSHKEAVAYVWSENATRRQLTSSQLAIAEAKRRQVDEEYAKRLEEEKPKRGRPEKEKEISPLSKDDRAATAKRAASVGTNQQYVKDADKIVKEHPEKAVEIELGKKTIPQVKQEIKREESRKNLASKAKSAAKILRDEQPPWLLMQAEVIDGLQSVLDHHAPARLIFADPPYNIGVDYGKGAKADKRPDYMMWVEEWLAMCVECLTPDGSLWVMIGDEYAAEYGCALKRVGLTIRSWIKWYETFGVNCSNNFNRTSRHIFYCTRTKNFVFHAAAVSRPSDRQTKYGDKRAAEGGKIWDDVWQIPRVVGSSAERIEGVPTQLPLALVQPIVECASDPGDLVVDPFNGSGTTGVACLRTLRKYIGIDQSAEYIGISEQRLMAEWHDARRAS